MKRVDKALAVGGARMSLRELAERTEQVFSGSRERPANVISSTGKGYRTKVIQEWCSRMAPLALLNNFDPTLGYGGSAVIVLFAARSKESATVFAQYLTGRRSGNGVGYNDREIATITQHALARMNQRIGLMRLRDITRLLASSIALLGAMSYTVKVGRCSIRQVSVPFADGAMRCDIDEERNVIIKTFVSLPSSREAPLLKELQLLIRSLTTERLEKFLWFPVHLEMVSKSPRRGQALLEMAELGVTLDNVFRGHHWLTEPYAKRLDPEGDVWELAQQQSTGA